MEPKTEKNEGIENVKRMFQTDEFGTISAELNSVYQAGLFGALVGCIYGGIIQSREAYVDFLEKNQATAFKDHLDAKKKLQNQFTVNFAKGGFKWGTRLGIFTTSFM
ncbi:TIMMDC1 family protein [Megaselia abdita]